MDSRMLKKRKLKSLVSSYEFAPRVPTTTKQLPTMGPSAVHKPSTVGRNALTDWTEHETFVLLDAWGDRFLQHGRKSLRSEEWQEVSEKVSKDSKVERTDSQCRNRLDTLKKKYKKEKLKLEEMGNGGSGTSKWVYFRKMDMLMLSPQQQGGGGDGGGVLSCGLNSGEYVFLSPRAYLNRANGLDEMRDGPGNSESEDGEEEEEEEERGLDKPAPSRKRRSGQNGNSKEEEGGSCLLLAKSIHKLSEIYERIEDRKGRQMVEIEKLRMDFLRDLEMQKRQIMERAQAEIAKLYRGGGEENGLSPKHPSK